LKNAYLHPWILRQKLTVTIIFDNCWVQFSFSSQVCTHRFKILKRVLLFIICKTYFNFSASELLSVTLIQNKIVKKFRKT